MTHKRNSYRGRRVLQRRQSAARRRGVLLLVVLSTLVLFLLIGTAFVVSSKQSEQASKSTTRAAANLAADLAQAQLLDEVARQLVRDTDNQQSSLRFHSLLADMYGADGMTATIAPIGAGTSLALPAARWAADDYNPNPSFAVAVTGAADPNEIGGVTAGQLVQLYVPLETPYGDPLAALPQDLHGNLLAPLVAPMDLLRGMSPVEDAYAGRLLTFITPGVNRGTTGVTPANAQGATTRIVRSRPIVDPTDNQPVGYELTVLAFKLADGRDLWSYDRAQFQASGRTNALNDLSGSRVLISGRPFNGTGAGLNMAAAAGTPRLNVCEFVPGTTQWSPLALLPNSKYFTAAELQLPTANPPTSITQTAQPLARLEQYLPANQRQLLAAAFGTNVSVDRAARATSLLEAVGLAGLGGADESYDAPDFQNLALGLIPGAENLIETTLVIPDPATLAPTTGRLEEGDASMVLPSFHRPALLNYWLNQPNQLLVAPSAGAAPQVNPNLLRKILVRPSPLDHPNFTGGNLELQAMTETHLGPTGGTLATATNFVNRLIYGPWDVDNDGDGVRDSVWVDFGAAPIALPNGKLVKPLAAILCVDLDGRINVNTAGSLDMAEVVQNVATRVELAALTTEANPIEANETPRGIGWGPAEISLMRTIGPDFQRLLTGQYEWGQQKIPQVGVYPNATGINIPAADRYVRSGDVPGGRTVGPGRYGADGWPGRPGFDLASQMTLGGWPVQQTQTEQTAVGVRTLSACASPSDLRGRYGTGLNLLGQPFYEAEIGNERAFALTKATQLNRPAGATRFAVGTYDQTYDNPYETDLSLNAPRGVIGGPGYDGIWGTADDVGSGDGNWATTADNLQQGADALFSLEEFERTQRLFDSDATILPERLGVLAGILPNGDFSDRLRITTDSYDVPAPTPVVPPQLESLLSASPVLRRLPESFGELVEMRVRGTLFAIDAASPTGALKTDPKSQERLFPGPLDLDGPGDGTGNVLPGTPNARRVRAILRQILAPELARGEKLNLNRPLGNGVDDEVDNGIDDNGDGRVDEPGEGNLVVDEPGEGNGLDDDNNGLVDDPYEWDLNNNGLVDRGEAQTAAWKFRTDPEAAGAADPAIAAAGLQNAALSIGNPGNLAAAALAASPVFPPMAVDVRPDATLAEGKPAAVDHRQLLARHLYVAALTLTTDAGYTGKRTLQGTGNKYDDAALARRLAQWAINVVDFRDPDNIMTPFEYDPNPFDGWNVDGDETKPIDGNLRTDADHLVTNPPVNAPRDTLVWGAERPELLITETMAWHDRRTEDHGDDDANQAEGDEGRPGTTESGRDGSKDNLFRPRGAFFMELYNPWTGLGASNADTHRVTAGQGRVTFGVDQGVNLGAVAQNASGTLKSPVWRVMVYRDPEQGKDPDDPLVRFRPQQPDRSIYFTSFDPQRVNVNWEDDGVAFCTQTRYQAAPVRPGRYCVVGSGTKDPSAPPTTENYVSPIGAVPPEDTQGTQLDVTTVKARIAKVEMDFTRAVPKLRVKDDGYEQIPPADFEDSNPDPDRRLSMTDLVLVDQVYNETNDAYDNMADRNPPAGQLSGYKTRRLTLSEPAEGYRDRIQNAEWDPELPDDDPQGLQYHEGQYANGPAPHDDTDALPVDIPLDDPNSGARRDGETKLGQAGQVMNYRTVYLQRLANPLLPWNPPRLKFDPSGASTVDPAHDPARPVNPYVTVDDSIVNLTVFEGQDATNNSLAQGRDLRAKFCSVERGWRNDPVNPQVPTETGTVASAPVSGNLWSPESPWSSDNNPANPANRNRRQGTNQNGAQQVRRIMDAVPEFTLGFLNQSYDAASDAAKKVPATVKSGPGPGNVNATPGRNSPRWYFPNEVQAANPAQPQPKPFPWLSWNNRPFASGNELLLAPRSRASRMLRDFSLATNGAGAAGQSTYGLAATDRPNTFVQAQQQAPIPQPPFAMLGNPFFEDNRTANTSVPPGVPNGLYRVLDYVHTPSLYAGTQESFNPLAFSEANVAIQKVQATDPRLHWQAPFNTLSTMREPGKLNLNTISSEDVYNDLFHVLGGAVRPDAGGSDHPGPLWEDFRKSRRGNSAGGPDMLQLANDSPTFFGNPLRGALEGDRVPLASMVQKTSGAGAALSGIESTLLRSKNPDADAVDANPLFAATTGQPHNDAGRSAFFATEPMTRLKNLTTTRSSVYQVWVTIGFFELEPVDGSTPTTQVLLNQIAGVNNATVAQARAAGPLFDQIYPGGYMFGREAADESGALRRLRGYYILDRSVPVGFEPGRNHNTDGVIRLQRQIE